MSAHLRIDTIKLQNSKMLAKMPNNIQSKWVKTGLVSVLEFEQVIISRNGQSAGFFSVKVDDAIRAHLLYDRLNQGWIAIDSKHKEMGHG